MRRVTYKWAHSKLGRWILDRWGARGVDYKSHWNQLAATEDIAKFYVIGSVKEDDFVITAEQSLGYLQETVTIDRDDIVLEIGCGVGRMGRVVAPICREWIGCDVSTNMLRHCAIRMHDHYNIRLIEVSGYDLSPIDDGSIDVVYCMVVFMHLEEWDRYRYVLEAFRVLKPKGRIYVDNFNLRSKEGWDVFEQSMACPPDKRPQHISRASTPQELRTYLERAGFDNIKVKESGAWIHAWASKT